jgi:hypothetical protein
MKILKLTFILTMLISPFFAEAKKIKIIRSNPGEDGRFNTVREEHTGFMPWSSHLLDCKNPGPIACGWTQPPIIGGYSVVDIEHFVLTEIANGNLSGSTNYNGTVRVIWVSDDAGNIEIEMNDEF